MSDRALRKRVADLKRQLAEARNEIIDSNEKVRRLRDALEKIKDAAISYSPMDDRERRIMEGLLIAAEIAIKALSAGVQEVK